MALNKEQKSSLVNKFGKTAGIDTGSPEVQVALLTAEVAQLTEHCKLNPKDFSSKRGLLRMVCSRAKLLKYLKRKDAARYKTVIGELGLRK